MKNLENKTEFISISKQQGIRGYIVKLKGYIFSGIKPDKNVSAKSILVYAKFPYTIDGRNN